MLTVESLPWSNWLLLDRTDILGKIRIIRASQGPKPRVEMHPLFAKTRRVRLSLNLQKKRTPSCPFQRPAALLWGSPR